MNRVSLAVVLALFAASARAQMGDPCVMSEITKLCGQPNGPDFKECAKTGFPTAMQTCRGSSKAAAEKSAGKSPCAEDMKKYCPGIWPGPELHECMSKHMSDVTPECAAYGKTMMSKHAHDKPMNAGDAACMADGKKLCPGLTGMDGQKFMDCLLSHDKELSSPCKKRLGSRDGGKTAECGAALKTVCPDAEIGSPEMMQCMMQHKDVIPAACRKGKK
jgi:hypothetical protein